MKLEEIKERVAAMVQQDTAITSLQIRRALKKEGIKSPHVTVINGWRKEAGGNVRKRKSRIGLELYPQDLPRHFAATLKRAYKVKRSGMHPDTGERNYHIERWESDERTLSVNYSTRFFADFLDKFEEICEAHVNIYQFINGEKFRIDTAGKLPENDGKVLGTKKKRKPGQRVSADDRQKIAIMFHHMAGDLKARYKWIAKQIGGIHANTVRRVVIEEKARETSGVPQAEDEGFMGAKWVGDKEMTSYPTIEDATDDWQRRQGKTVDGMKLVKDEQEERRAA